MGKLNTYTYLVSSGTGDLPINADGKPLDIDKVSFHVKGDASVNGAVTVKLQETNVYGEAHKDITGASVTANVSTTEYNGQYTIGGAYLNVAIDVGTATTGTITVLLYYK